LSRPAAFLRRGVEDEEELEFALTGLQRQPD
jgi:hypothetical protein